MSKIRRNWFPLTLALCVLACLISIGYVFAQVSPQIQGAGAPANPCNNGGQQYVDQTNHVIYSCPSSGSNWVNIGLGQTTGSPVSANNLELPANGVFQFSNTNGVASATADTGISRNAADQIYFGNGTQGDLSARLFFAQGTLAAPALNFNAAAGLYSPSANEIDFSIFSNATRFQVASSLTNQVDLNSLSGPVRIYGNGNSGQIVIRSPLQLGDGTTGGQITQNAASTTGGTCTMSTTTCTITLAVHYASGLCNANTSGASAIAAACSVSTATPSVITVTAASSNTQAWSAIAWGNPN